MKKIAMILILVASVMIGHAQKNVRQSASNYLKQGKLDKALEAINACVVESTTANDAKSWFLRGNIYMEIANSKDENYKKLDPDPVTKALESYKKALEVDPKKEMEKKEYYGDIANKLYSLYKVYFDSALNCYNRKDYSAAMSNFGQSALMLEPIGSTDTLSLLNAALCAGPNYADQKGEAKKYYIKLINGNYKSPAVFADLSAIYLKEKDSANAFKYIRLGLKEYPNNLSLLNNEINIYLSYNIVDKAMKNLNIAMMKDSSNYTIPFALGTLYDNINSDTSKSVAQRNDAYLNAEKYYMKAVKIKPDYIDALYNLGALNLNKAVEYISTANNLPLDASEENNRLKAQAEGYLIKASDYFEKQIEIQLDANSKRVLMQIYTQLKQIYEQLNMPEKKAKIQEKIDALKKK